MKKYVFPEICNENQKIMKNKQTRALTAPHSLKNTFAWTCQWLLALRMPKNSWHLQKLSAMQQHLVLNGLHQYVLKRQRCVFCRRCAWLEKRPARGETRDPASVQAAAPPVRFALQALCRSPSPVGLRSPEIKNDECSNQFAAGAYPAPSSLKLCAASCCSCA